jgi:predicted dehydrogenase
MEKKKLGVVLVGLGSYATNQLAPALQETKYCKLTGIVTGSPSKKEPWMKKFRIPESNVYNYQNFDRIAQNSEIDIVYIVLPNSLHAEFSIRAAKAGKHVICEKPMAMDEQECLEMIKACKEAGVSLSIGYRLHFDPFNKEMMNLGQKEKMGKIKRIESGHCFYLKDPNNIRAKKDLGGGPLGDLGIYCIQGARYTLGEEPIAVTAKYIDKTNPKVTKEVEEGMEWEMEFPGGAVAKCYTSFVDECSYLKVETEKGWFKLDPAFAYGGLKGETSEGPMDLQNINQQAAQMDAIAECILKGEPSPVPGEEGIKDVKIISAIFKAADTGGRVEIKI